MVKVPHDELCRCEVLGDDLYLDGRKILWVPYILKRKFASISEPSSESRPSKKSRTSPEGSPQDEQDATVSSSQITQDPAPFVQPQGYRPTSYPDVLFPPAKSQQQTTLEAPESQYTSKFLLGIK